MFKKDLFGWIGIAVGSIALLLAMVHFYAGPFSPQPTLESLVASKTVAIKQSLLASLTGHRVSESPLQPHYNLDQLLKVVIAILAASSVIFGVIGGARRENRRAVSGALMLGAGTLAFQMAVFAFGVIAVIVLIAVVLPLIMGSLGDWWSSLF
ncbi:hypothetical protein [Serratia aquatilis]|uniref:Inner membrane protein yidI n=1 Tax=Serratia aquatilis TaxID=1737515 RepID=A0ABV6EB36_9GAMM